MPPVKAGGFCCDFLKPIDSSWNPWYPWYIPNVTKAKVNHSLVKDDVTTAQGIAQSIATSAEMRRQELGMTYQEIAKGMGVSQSEVTRIFSAAPSTSLLNFTRLGRVLKMSVAVTAK